MKRIKRIIPTILLLLVFFVGLSVLCYPTFSDWWNSRVQSRAIGVYDEAVLALSEKDYTEYFEAARDYNERLAKVGSAVALPNPDLVEGYENILDITGTGIMGYITIEKINVELPIYHGTSAAVLQSGVGHLEGSSLPIGYESTHSVLSAHTGLPSAKLFTNLDQMKVGDTFTVTVLNKILTYQVDQILVVLPNEIENLYIKEGMDYCTLMTCTPYGINTHRLLVRGSRIYPEGARKETVTVPEETEGKKLEIPYWAKYVAIGLGALFVVYLISEIMVRTIRFARRKKKEDQEEISK